MTLWKEISADSLTPNVKRMEAEVLKVNDPALKAVRYAVLGKVYRDMNEKKSQEFFKKALGQPELLARHTSAEYVPLTLKGVDGSSFNNDLLHLIGFEADSKEAYLQLYTYYNKVGNRGAACLCAYKLIEKYRQDDVREVKNRSICRPSTRSSRFIRIFRRQANLPWSISASWKVLPMPNRRISSTISTMR